MKTPQRRKNCGTCNSRTKSEKVLRILHSKWLLLLLMLALTDSSYGQFGFPILDNVVGEAENTIDNVVGETGNTIDKITGFPNHNSNLFPSKHKENGNNEELVGFGDEKLNTVPKVVTAVEALDVGNDNNIYPTPEIVFESGNSDEEKASDEIPYSNVVSNVENHDKPNVEQPPFVDLTVSEDASEKPNTVSEDPITVFEDVSEGPISVILKPSTESAVSSDMPGTPIDSSSTKKSTTFDELTTSPSEIHSDSSTNTIPKDTYSIPPLPITLPSAITPSKASTIEDIKSIESIPVETNKTKEIDETKKELATTHLDTEKITNVGIGLSTDQTPSKEIGSIESGIITTETSPVYKISESKTKYPTQDIGTGVISTTSESLPKNIAFDEDVVEKHHATTTLRNPVPVLSTQKPSIGSTVSSNIELTSSRKPEEIGTTVNTDEDQTNHATTKSPQQSTSAADVDNHKDSTIESSTQDVRSAIISTTLESLPNNIAFEEDVVEKHHSTTTLKQPDPVSPTETPPAGTTLTSDTALTVPEKPDDITTTTKIEVDNHTDSKIESSTQDVRSAIISTTLESLPNNIAFDEDVVEKHHSSTTLKQPDPVSPTETPTAGTTLTSDTALTVPEKPEDITTTTKIEVDNHTDSKIESSTQDVRSAIISTTLESLPNNIAFEEDVVEKHHSSTTLKQPDPVSPTETPTAGTTLTSDTALTVPEKPEDITTTAKIEVDNHTDSKIESSTQDVRSAIISTTLESLPNNIAFEEDVVEKHHSSTTLKQPDPVSPTETPTAGTTLTSDTALTVPEKPEDITTTAKIEVDNHTDSKIEFSTQDVRSAIISTTLESLPNNIAFEEDVVEKHHSTTTLKQPDPLSPTETPTAGTTLTSDTALTVPEKPEDITTTAKIEVDNHTDSKIESSTQDVRSAIISTTLESLPNNIAFEEDVVEKHHSTTTLNQPDPLSPTETPPAGTTLTSDTALTVPEKPEDITTTAKIEFDNHTDSKIESSTQDVRSAIISTTLESLPNNIAFEEDVVEKHHSTTTLKQPDPLSPTETPTAGTTLTSDTALTVPEKPEDITTTAKIEVDNHTDSKIESSTQDVRSAIISTTLEYLPNNIAFEEDVVEKHHSTTTLKQPDPVSPTETPTAGTTLTSDTALTVPEKPEDITTTAKIEVDNHTDSKIESSTQDVRSAIISTTLESLPNNIAFEEDVVEKHHSTTTLKQPDPLSPTETPPAGTTLTSDTALTVPEKPEDITTTAKIEVDNHTDSKIESSTQDVRSAIISTTLESLPNNIAFDEDVVEKHHSTTTLKQPDPLSPTETPPAGTTLTSDTALTVPEKPEDITTTAKIDVDNHTDSKIESSTQDVRSAIISTTLESLPNNIAFDEDVVEKHHSTTTLKQPDPLSPTETPPAGTTLTSDTALTVPEKPEDITTTAKIDVDNHTDSKIESSTQDVRSAIISTTLESLPNNIAFEEDVVEKHHSTTTLKQPDPVSPTETPPAGTTLTSDTALTVPEKPEDITTTAKIDVDNHTDSKIESSTQDVRSAIISTTLESLPNNIAFEEDVVEKHHSTTTLKQPDPVSPTETPPAGTILTSDTALTVPENPEDITTTAKIEVDNHTDSKIESSTQDVRSAIISTTLESLPNNIAFEEDVVEKHHSTTTLKQPDPVSPTETPPAGTILTSDTALTVPENPEDITTTAKIEVDNHTDSKIESSTQDVRSAIISTTLESLPNNIAFEEDVVEKHHSTTTLKQPDPVSPTETPPAGTILTSDTALTVPENPEDITTTAKIEVDNHTDSKIESSTQDVRSAIISTTLESLPNNIAFEEDVVEKHHSTTTLKQPDPVSPTETPPAGTTLTSDIASTVPEKTQDITTTAKIKVDKVEIESITAPSFKSENDNSSSTPEISTQNLSKEVPYSNHDDNGNVLQRPIVTDRPDKEHSRPYGDELGSNSEKPKTTSGTINEEKDYSPKTDNEDKSKVTTGEIGIDTSTESHLSLNYTNRPLELDNQIKPPSVENNVININVSKGDSLQNLPNNGQEGPNSDELEIPYTNEVSKDDGNDTLDIPYENKVENIDTTTSLLPTEVEPNQETSTLVSSTTLHKATTTPKLIEGTSTFKEIISTDITTEYISTQEILSNGSTTKLSTPENTITEGSTTINNQNSAILTSTTGAFEEVTNTVPHTSEKSNTNFQNPSTISTNNFTTISTIKTNGSESNLSNNEGVSPEYTVASTDKYLTTLKVPQTSYKTSKLPNLNTESTISVDHNDMSSATITVLTSDKLNINTKLTTEPTNVENGTETVSTRKTGTSAPPITTSDNENRMSSISIKEPIDMTTKIIFTTDEPNISSTPPLSATDFSNTIKTDEEFTLETGIELTTKRNDISDIQNKTSNTQVPTNSSINGEKESKNAKSCATSALTTGLTYGAMGGSAGAVGAVFSQIVKMIADMMKSKDDGNNKSEKGKKDSKDEEIEKDNPEDVERGQSDGGKGHSDDNSSNGSNQGDVMQELNKKLDKTADDLVGKVEEEINIVEDQVVGTIKDRLAETSNQILGDIKTHMLHGNGNILTNVKSLFADGENNILTDIKKRLIETKSKIYTDVKSTIKNSIDQDEDLIQLKEIENVFNTDTTIDIKDNCILHKGLSKSVDNINERIKSQFYQSEQAISYDIEGHMEKIENDIVQEIKIKLLHYSAIISALNINMANSKNSILKDVRGKLLQTEILLQEGIRINMNHVLFTSRQALERRTSWPIVRNDYLGQTCTLETINEKEKLLLKEKSQGISEKLQMKKLDAIEIINEKLHKGKTDATDVVIKQQGLDLLKHFRKNQKPLETISSNIGDNLSGVSDPVKNFRKLSTKSI